MATNRPKTAKANGAAAELFAILTMKGGILPTDEVKGACQTLVLKAGQYHTCMEDHCNGGTNAQKANYNAKRIDWDDIEKELNGRQQLLEQVIHSAALALTRNLVSRGADGNEHVKVEFQGDPRGFTVILHLPNGLNNRWGGGYGVPHNRGNE
jgi:hypothetical protein